MVTFEGDYENDNEIYGEVISELKGFYSKFNKLRLSLSKKNNLNQKDKSEEERITE